MNTSKKFLRKLNHGGWVKHHIAFSTICDNITHLKRILISGQYETDETECEQWSCNTIYTRCDGIWNCFNGEDELDCYPPSIINCSLHSYECFSSNTGDYMCLSADKLNDGNIDCLGAVDESQYCRKNNGQYRIGGFHCDSTTSEYCLSPSRLCDGQQMCSQGEDEKFCHHIKTKDPFRLDDSCAEGYISTRSDVEEFVCKLFNPSAIKSSIVHFSLDSMENPPNT